MEAAQTAARGTRRHARSSPALLGRRRARLLRGRGVVNVYMFGPVLGRSPKIIYTSYIMVGVRTANNDHDDDPECQICFEQNPKAHYKHARTADAHERVHSSYCVACANRWDARRAARRERLTCPTCGVLAERVAPAAVAVNRAALAARQAAARRLARPAVVKKPLLLMTTLIATLIGSGLGVQQRLAHLQRLEAARLEAARLEAARRTRLGMGGAVGAGILGIAGAAAMGIGGYGTINIKFQERVDRYGRHFWSSAEGHTMWIDSNRIQLQHHTDHWVSQRFANLRDMRNECVLTCTLDNTQSINATIRFAHVTYTNVKFEKQA